jgi:hypothetical protein
LILVRSLADAPQISHFAERFDEDWWRNPRTAPHLAGLLAAGRLPPGEEAPAGGLAAHCLVAKLEGGG